LAKVLLLNVSYEPLNVCSWKRAITLILKGKAEQLEHNGKLINNAIECPSVIRLKHFVIVPYKDIPLTRRNVLHRDEYACQYCGKTNQPLTVDHIIPRSRGGKHYWNNVVAACLKCNNKKGNKTPKEANMTLTCNPTTPPNRMEFEITKLTKTATIQAEWVKYL
jgi:5-methylcytosine-specific restriction endonuclease McrA